MRRWLLAAALGGVVAAFAYRRRLLTLDGALAAAAVGAVTFGRAGVPGAAALLTFFFSSSALSRGSKGARRNAWQVLANGGAATLALARGSPSGFVCALAEAGADTWATEIGMRSEQRARLITSFRVVEAGRSGGVTPIGLLASVGGAGVVGLAWVLASGSWRELRLAVVVGTLGSVLDSVLGATVQALYRCQVCQRLVEASAHCGQRAGLVHGVSLVSNDVVNGIVTASAALAGAATGRDARTRRLPS